MSVIFEFYYIYAIPDFILLNYVKICELYQRIHKLYKRVVNYINYCPISLASHLPFPISFDNYTNMYVYQLHVYNYLPDIYIQSLTLYPLSLVSFLPLLVLLTILVPIIYSYEL